MSQLVDQLRESAKRAALAEMQLDRVRNRIVGLAESCEPCEAYLRCLTHGGELGDSGHCELVEDLAKVVGSVML